MFRHLKGTLGKKKFPIIEAPTRILDLVREGGRRDLKEPRQFSVTALTRLRTLNGPALVERCYRSWKQNQPINLHYRDEAGLEATAPILAARAVETDDGQILLLWLHVERDDMELEIGADDEDDDDDDNDDDEYEDDL